MTLDLFNPPAPQLTDARLAARRQHLLSEILAAEAEPRSIPSSRPRLARRRRRYLAFALALLVVLVPLTAVASTQGWWFLGHGAPEPITPVSVVATGRWNGVAWTLTAYRSGTDGVCWALTPDLAGKQAGRGAGMACDTISGVPRTSQSKPFTPHGITFMQSFDPNGLGAYVTGPVIQQATQVEIALWNGKVVRARTLAAPKSLGSKIRFYATQLPAAHAAGPGYFRQGVRELVGLDGQGHVVARLHVPLPPLARPENRISNQGQAVALSQAMRHRLRLAHRSGRVWLLASRDGRNFYRFGNCFGIGRTGDPASFPAAEGPAAFGEMLCAPQFPSSRRPVLDGSVFGQTRGQKRMTLIRLQGFASDEVRSVTLIGAHGQVLRRVPVVANVYSLAHVPRGVLIVAMSDKSGKLIAGCGPNVGLTGGGSYLKRAC